LTARAFAPPWWLANPHLQTIYGAIAVRAPRIALRRERWDTPDGDFVDVDFMDGPTGAPWVHLYHGLEGSSNSPYARALMAHVKARGWRGTVFHFRGCSGEPNRLPRAYHSGDSAEIDWSLREVRRRAGAAPVYVAGVSLGGNALAKWLGESGAGALEVVQAAAVVSAPLDLMAAGDALGRGFALNYARHFLQSLKSSTREKLERFPGLVDEAAMRRSRTLRDFDNVVTAPLHGFRDTDDYWTRASAKPLLGNVRVPTLVINARDDPFLPEKALPTEREVSSAVSLEFPARGGHVGFVSGPFPGNPDWLPTRILHFFEHAAMTAATTTVAPEIFKAYDIRGIVDKTLTEEAVEKIGRALATMGKARGVSRFVVGRDGRMSGPRLSVALAKGLNAAGADVIDVGVVATPMVYFATHLFDTGSGVMVTGSHNPPEYNGLKMMVAGDTLAAETIQDLRRIVDKGEFSSGKGRYETADVSGPYLDRIASDVKLARPMTIAVDCGNGSPGAFAPKLFRRLGCEVIELFCEVDGTFPNHHPDPSKPENLKDLISELARTDAEVGLAFDGDGDRLGVVTKNGKIIYPDRQLMLFAEEVLSRNPGAQIIFDVKCTRNLFPWIRKHGGEPLLWKTGHSLIKAKLKETGAPLAGEMSGHVFFKDRWYGFDDGMYAGARMLELLSRVENATKLLESLPDSISTPEINVALEREGENHKLIAGLQKTAKFEGSTGVNTIDGLRVEYPDGFGLMRASNTTPVIVLRFEADNDAALARIQREFKKVLLSAKPDARVPF